MFIVISNAACCVDGGGAGLKQCCVSVEFLP